MNILDFAASQGWAMLPERAEELVAIADRAVDVKPEALEAYRSRTMDRADRARIRDGVAILDVQGPLFKKANLFVEISGATSYDILRRDLQVALDDPNVHAILLCIDSPGGEANGCDELASAIFAARSVKPVTAYVSGMCASGGFWLGSAASRIVVSEAAMLGSIGVVLGIQDKRAADERRGVKTIEFVSSQSPGKRPDPSTDEGRNRIQAMVDDLAEVFIGAVAKHRNVSAADVVSKFGGGGMLIGAKAVAAGMADEVGQMEAVISDLITSGRKGRLIPRSTGGFSMSDTTTSPTVDENAVKARIKDITHCDLGKQSPTLAGLLAFDTAIPAADALKMLAAAKDDWPKAEESKPAATTAEPAVDPAAATAAFAASKAQAGALGLAEPAGGEDKKAKSSAVWKRTMESVNARYQ